tara:strand:- start:1432 stop:2031 length:600 start_codon:yes stop_codon:yes gene_type:complete
MQYTKRDWRNRNLIKTPRGLKWLSIPVIVKGKYFQKIKDTKTLDNSWIRSHLSILKQNYQGARYFKEMWPWVESTYYSSDYKYLTEINLHFINEINKLLDIKSEIKFSSEFDLHEERNLRLINICKRLNGTDYYSGPSAKSYINEKLFSDNNINIHYLNYSNYPQYSQLYDGFEHGVTILDLLLNEGIGSFKFLTKVKL